MKHLLKLYPKTWRDRYGDEFDALLEERGQGVLDTVDVVRGALDAQLRTRMHRARDARRPGITEMPLQRDEMRDELRAILSARAELGPDAEQDLVESFLDLLDERGLSSPHGATASNRVRLPSLSQIARWLSALLGLWIFAGISSIVTGFPWSMVSTDPVQIFAMAMVSGYAGVLVVLVFAVCMAWIAWLVARHVRGSQQLRYPTRT